MKMELAAEVTDLVSCRVESLKTKENEKYKSEEEEEEEEEEEKEGEESKKLERDEIR